MTSLDEGLTAYVVENPGRILTLSAHRRVYEALIPVTSQSFGADMTPYWAQRSREGYLERLAEFVFVCDDMGTLVGWTGYHVLRFDEHIIVYLDSTGMVPSHQSRGTMRALLRDRIANGALPRCAGDSPVFLAARTESPIFFRLMRGIVNDAVMFPNPGIPTPAEVQLCGINLGTWLGQLDLLEPSTLMLRNAYDTLDELYGELPTTGDPDLDEMFRGALGPLDAFLLVSRIR
ncbi:hypothetical protein E1287_15230 [Actinomadura sp. KC06]|uniref:GNAT family N-acetyltransferase n=1 Tax=Actinomadura sp. KC06 TaxID=2530369 RepID=UPI0010517B15|nr:GNAT family N-acetyltransferase [Actinomadura sp. KC06]TDD34973.1 hypothetical protein E1287_15230 [Actinomadura sp. KC06]